VRREDEEALLERRAREPVCIAMSPACAGRSWNGRASNTQKTRVASRPSTPRPNPGKAPTAPRAASTIPLWDAAPSAATARLASETCDVMTPRTTSPAGRQRMAESTQLVLECMRKIA